MALFSDHPGSSQPRTIGSAGLMLLACWVSFGLFLACSHSFRCFVVEGWRLGSKALRLLL